MDATGPNAEQITYWNEQSGPKWVANQARLDRMIAPFGLAAMEALAVAAAERVVDVGCGCGDSTITLGRRVGDAGSVLGVDVSSVMLSHARSRAAGSPNVRFLVADVQTHAFDAGTHDAAFSRFGVMFFADPTAAFANLRRALRSGGRLAFACWQGLADNPWMLVPLGAAAQHIPLPAPPPPGAPGPFAFADRDRVRGILEGAGFLQVTIEPFAPTVIVGEDVDAATEFVLQLGPTGTALREAGPGAAPRVADAIRQALEPYRTADGVVMPSASWIVTAGA